MTIFVARLLVAERAEEILVVVSFANGSSSSMLGGLQRDAEDASTSAWNAGLVRVGRRERVARALELGRRTPLRFAIEQLRDLLAVVDVGRDLLELRLGLSAT